MFRRYHNDAREAGIQLMVKRYQTSSLFLMYCLDLVSYSNMFLGLINYQFYQFTLALVEKVQIHWLIYGTQSILKWLQL